MISIKQYCNERLFKLSRIKLLPNEIHLWSINWKELEDYIHKYKNLISIQEEQRVYSFKFYEDRMRCMTGKILTKLLLAHYLEVDCLDIQICYEKNGKPYHMPIKDKRLIQFNVSHSGEFVFMGFAYEKRIGVDIEKINLSFQYQCISDKFFSKKEIEDINKSKNIEKFYNLWTAKEAYVKAIGKGLFKEFKSFSVSEDIIKENNKIEEGWFLKNIKLNEEYVACVVLQK